MKTKLPLFLFAALLFSFSSCVKEGADVVVNYYDKEGYDEMKQVLNLPEPPLVYVNDFPAYYIGFSAPFDTDLATLGRVIFYDKALSSDGSVACASCHIQAAGFADNKVFSDGVNGEVTARNSLALGSVFSFQEYYGSVFSNRVPFFWDNRASSVEDQSRETFANSREMDMKMHEVVSEVNKRAYYKPLISKVRGNTTVADETTILNAVSVFVNSISSMNSKYDDVLSAYFLEKGHINDIASVNLSGLSDVENLGKALYMNNCASCHGETNGFPGEIQANNGLSDYTGDQGIGEIQGSNFNGVFKVPTLRNITLTAPYMHDGRFATIDEVLDHYQSLSSAPAHPNLSQQLRVNDNPSGLPKTMHFSSAGREALKAFFNTFEDNHMATAEKYADPFIR
jgi:cytochrome c peroxidase